MKVGIILQVICLPSIRWFVKDHDHIAADARTKRDGSRMGWQFNCNIIAHKWLAVCIAMWCWKGGTHHLGIVTQPVDISWSVFPTHTSHIQCSFWYCWCGFPSCCWVPGRWAGKFWCSSATSHTSLLRYFPWSIWKRLNGYLIFHDISIFQANFWTSRRHRGDAKGETTSKSPNTILGLVDWWDRGLYPSIT